MSADLEPPVLATLAPARGVARWRWWVHLVLLAGYVLGIGLIGFREREEPAGGSMLPPTTEGVLLLCAGELVLFGAVFGVAWLFSRADAGQLWLRWRGGVKPVLWGALYSALLRVGIGIAVAMVAIPLSMSAGKEGTEKAMEKLRPRVEAVVNAKALVEDPFYLLVATTLVSFVVAGFREELWRAGMVAGLAAVAPGIFSSRRGKYGAVVIAAVVFGLGHFPQGGGGVLLTGLLGLGLGFIMVRHDSIWEAVMAHGFFNASTFVMLYAITRWFPGVLPGL